MVRKMMFAAVALASAASPALAQSGTSWNGFYVGGRIGYAATPLKTSNGVLFDNNLDGKFGDTVTTTTGANAFSPGFCNGAAISNLAADRCKADNDGLDYGVHAGADYQFGRLVVGALVEYDRTNARDIATAFSTTPASYTLSREARGTMGARARLGFALDSALPYVTAGLVRSKIRNSFSTSNTANSFATQGGGYQNGYRVGGGFEQRFGRLSLGALYLFTNVKDNDFRVNVTRGAAPATNPFVLTNPAGTQFRFASERFKTHSASLTASYRF